jgi:phosphatidylserine/phosphatidylglycerophosphate/cardiolipin synthase-like enzyme
VAKRPDLLERSDLEMSAGARVSDMVVTLTMAALRDLKWVVEGGGQRRELAVPSSWLDRLGDRLDGAADYQEATEPPGLPEVILTRPRDPSRLVEALTNAGAPSTYWTRDGFVHLASQACESLRIMTPFIDETGAKLVAEMFDRATGHRRVLILRPASRGDRSWLTDHLRPGVTIKEYWQQSVDRNGATGIETFHAKIIVADDRLAYVGSSNFVSASLDRSLECGVLLRGREVRTVAALMDAVEQISTVVFAP